MKLNKVIFAFLLIAICKTTIAQRVPIDQVNRVISYLASDKLNGRGAGTMDEKIAAKFIAEQMDAMHLEPKGNKGYYYDFVFHKNNNPHDENAHSKEQFTGRNVIGFLDNNATNTIVIGAHYDHVGLGLDKNSLDPNPEGKIHNGADDNASGVAGVLALAHYFSTNGYKENYNFLFMTFTGEELGLIGSKKWCENPTYPLANINYMINMDMIGRLNDTTKKLLVYGIGTSNSWKNVIEKTNSYFSIKEDSAGIGPSDQTSFYLKDIPVLHFFTGQHSDYHKPTDDADKINLKGEVLVLEYIIDVINELNDKPKLQFFKTASPESSKMSFKVTLGIMPDYAFDGNGLRIDGVTDNKPAANAGILRGDILVEMDGQKINTIQDYMKTLSTCKKGDRKTVSVLRNNELLNLEVQF